MMQGCLFLPREPLNTAFGERESILIISVDMFLSTSLGLRKRQSLTWYLFNLSRTPVVHLKFSVCFSLVSLVCPLSRAGLVLIPRRRPLCFHPTDSGRGIPIPPLPKIIHKLVKNSNVKWVVPHELRDLFSWGDRHYSEYDFYWALHLYSLMKYFRVNFFVS